MKIMTFNIWEGGIDDLGSRIDFIIDVIKEANPDFLALQEANNFDKDGDALLKKISNEIALPYYALSPGSLHENGKRYHVVSLSRFPLLEEYRFPGFLADQATLSVVVDSPLGELSLCNLHLHAHSEDKRLNELEIILKYQSRYKTHILLGDFNAISSSDNYGDLSAREFTHFDFVRFDVTDMLNKSYLDTLAHLSAEDRYTSPTAGVSHPISKSPIRIDYILVTPSLTTRIRSATVIKTPTSEKASDHYPVTLTLE